jgi:hypothetical protein
MIKALRLEETDLDGGRLTGRTRWVCKGLEEGRASSYNKWSFTMSEKALMLENGVKAIDRVTGEIASAFKRTSARLWH